MSCEVCGRTYTTKPGLAYHMRSQHSNQPKEVLGNWLNGTELRSGRVVNLEPLSASDSIKFVVTLPSIFTFRKPQLLIYW